MDEQSKLSALHSWHADTPTWKRNPTMRRLLQQDPVLLSIGSAGIIQEGWLGSDQDEIDLLDDATWRRFFSPGSLDAIFAEHVWEHLTLEDGASAARQCYRYLRWGAYLRLAVPDGLHPDPDYIEWVRPGGIGAGADDHKVLYDYRSLGEMLADVGFEVQLLEYFDEHGEFHFVHWEPGDGLVRRSSRFDQRNTDRLAYTSLIIDAHKPRLWNLLLRK